MRAALGKGADWYADGPYICSEIAGGRPGGEVIAEVKPTYAGLFDRERAREIAKVIVEAVNAQRAALAASEGPVGGTVAIDVDGSTRRCCNTCSASIPWDSKTGLCASCESPAPTASFRTRELLQGQEALCGTAETAATSMNEGILPIANNAAPSGGLLLPEEEWIHLSNETRNKLQTWFRLATERLQLILDEPQQQAAEDKK